MDLVTSQKKNKEDFFLHLALKIKKNSIDKIFFSSILFLKDTDKGMIPKFEEVE